MRKRSKYRPKPVLADPLNHVLGGFKRISTLSEGTTLMIKNHDAMDRLRRGEADRDAIDLLIAAFNIAEALMRLPPSLGTVGEEYKVEIRAAQDALFAVGSRGAETGKFILGGPELIALNLGLEVHDAQLEACTVAQLEVAIDIVAEEIRNRRARVIKERKKDDISSPA